MKWGRARPLLLLPRLYFQYGFLLVFLEVTLFHGECLRRGSLAGASQHNREMLFPCIFPQLLLLWVWGCRAQPQESCESIADVSWPNFGRFFQPAPLITSRSVSK